MKKNYFLTFTLLAFTMMLNAQIISDDFESYTTGAIGVQSADWSTYDAASSPAEDLQIVTDFFNSGAQAGYVGNATAQDAMLLLGNLTSGVYTLTFQMRVTPTGSAYFNIQGATTGSYATPNRKNSGDILFNNGTNTNAGNGSDSRDGSTFTYPTDGSFFPVNILFDLDNSTYTLYVNGVQVNPVPVVFAKDTTLGAIDFYRFYSANNSFWIDDVLFESGNTLGISNKTIEGFAIYPNPVKNVLHIKTNDAVTSVTVYDVLGKVALRTQPNAMSPSINTSDLASGMYLVEIKVGSNTKTVKIIK